MLLTGLLIVSLGRFPTHEIRTFDPVVHAYLVATVEPTPTLVLKDERRYVTSAPKGPVKTAYQGSSRRVPCTVHKHDWTDPPKGSWAV